MRKLIMSASAIALGVAGLAASFLPHEALTYFGVTSGGALPLFVQVIGALYLAFAMLNWMARESLIGGIYNRPIATGNFLHFVVGALALGKGGLLVATVPYALFAIAFGWILFTSPVRAATPTTPAP